MITKIVSDGQVLSEQLNKGESHCVMVIGNIASDMEMVYLFFFQKGNERLVVEIRKGIEIHVEIAHEG